MPYQHGNTPKWIYRVDHRSPAEIFQNGFQPWGTLADFFQHVMGASLGEDLPVEQRSRFIAASDSPDSALRFFGSGLYMPTWHPDINTIYLYQIAADENTYSAIRTAEYYLGLINEDRLTVHAGTHNAALAAVLAVLHDFAYQREWFHDGPIAANQVHSAWRVDSVAVNPTHVRHQQEIVFFLPRINDPEIVNEHYVETGNLANPLPYGYVPETVAPASVSVPSEVVASDVAGGVSSSMGFACSPESDPGPSERHKRSNLLVNEPIVPKSYQYCYIDQALIRKPLTNTTIPVQPLVLRNAFPTTFCLIGKNSRIPYVWGWDNNRQKMVVYPYQQSQRQKPQYPMIYDQYQRFSLEPTSGNLSLAVSMQPTAQADTYECALQIASTNDVFQKFHYELIPNFFTPYLVFRIKNVFLQDFSLHLAYKPNTVEPYLAWKKYLALDPYAEELLLVVDETHFSESCVLLPQSSPSQLVDLGLSWFYEKQNYTFDQTNNSSFPAPLPVKTMFYDLQTLQIKYVSKRKNQLYCLYNAKTKDQEWNWIRWADYIPNFDHDSHTQWYFVNRVWKDNFFNLNWRNIRSLLDNSYLRVVVSGIHWGSLYTTIFRSDINSIAIFNLFNTVDL